MAIKKKRKITLGEQRAAAEILCAFMFVKIPEELNEEFNKLWFKFYDLYELETDPFTFCPCTPKEYGKLRLKFDKQIMESMYGHCDGLE